MKNLKILFIIQTIVFGAMEGVTLGHYYDTGMTNKAGMLGAIMLFTLLALFSLYYWMKEEKNEI